VIAHCPHGVSPPTPMGNACAAHHHGNIDYQFEKIQVLVAGTSGTQTAHNGFFTSRGTQRRRGDGRHWRLGVGRETRMDPVSPMGLRTKLFDGRASRCHNS
jgi:hypothetical protein